MSTLDHKLKPEATEVRRLEVITGTGRRRQFSEDFKSEVVAETLVAGAVVSEVARRRGLTPQQVFTWRRQARTLPAPGAESTAPRFVPAVIEPKASAGVAPVRRRKQAHDADRISGLIEVEAAGITVRIGRGADAKTIAAVLRLLKAGG
jgi:transposase